MSPEGGGRLASGRGPPFPAAGHWEPRIHLALQQVEAEADVGSPGPHSGPSMWPDARPGHPRMPSVLSTTAPVTEQAPALEVTDPLGVTLKQRRSVPPGDPTARTARWGSGRSWVPAAGSSSSLTRPPSWCLCAVCNLCDPADDLWTLPASEGAGSKRPASCRAAPPFDLGPRLQQPPPLRPRGVPSEPRPPPQHREPPHAQRRLAALPGLQGGPPAPGPVPGEGWWRRRAPARPGRHERAARRRRPRPLLARRLAGKGARLGAGRSREAGTCSCLRHRAPPSKQGLAGVGAPPSVSVCPPENWGPAGLLGTGCACQSFPAPIGARPQLGRGAVRS